jgi:hypothetical protein
MSGRERPLGKGRTKTDATDFAQVLAAEMGGRVEPSRDLTRAEFILGELCISVRRAEAGVRIVLLSSTADGGGPSLITSINRSLFEVVADVKKLISEHEADMREIAERYEARQRIETRVCPAPATAEEIEAAQIEARKQMAAALAAAKSKRRRAQAERFAAYHNGAYAPRKWARGPAGALAALPGVSASPMANRIHGRRA